MAYDQALADTVLTPGAGPESTAAASEPPPRAGGSLAAAWSAVTAVIAAVMGVAPHVLHHLGLFAGTAFAVGMGGNLLFGALGLLLSIPLLRRLYRRFGTWKAPAAAIAVFAVMFSASAFLIGPAINSSASSDSVQSPSPTTPVDHEVHHGG